MPEGMGALVQSLAPGGRLVRSRRLRGGLGAQMHTLTIARPGDQPEDGMRWTVSLRRFPRSDWAWHQPKGVLQSFETLRLVERAGIPAPRALLLDLEGRFFGMPAFVQSYLPGGAWWPYDGRAESWTEGLARGAALLHAVAPENFDLSPLRRVGLEAMHEGNQEKRKELPVGDGLIAEAAGALEERLGDVTAGPPCLVHQDYHPGNTVWLRGKLAGIIDWEDAAVWDARMDVAQCRADLVISHDAEVADHFADAYRRLTSNPLWGLWYFDLYSGLRALLHFRQWLEAYRDAGVAHLAASDVDTRLRAFLERALREAAP